MDKIVAGYGSEWHLLRYMGRHRQNLTVKLLAALDTAKD